MGAWHIRQLILCSIVLACNAYGRRYYGRRNEQIEMKLQHGRSPYEGNVYVKFSSESRWTGPSGWGLLCDSRWNMRSALVVCGMLGYTRVMNVTSTNYFGSSSSEEIVLKEVICNGFEEELSRCSRSQRSRKQCTYADAAGVVCDPHSKALTDTISPPIEQEIERVFHPNSPETKAYFKLIDTLNPPRTLKHKSAAAAVASADMYMYSNDEAFSYTYREYVPQESNSISQTKMQVKGVELVNGRNPVEGYVKVTLNNGESGTICADDWGTFEALVVCKQLGMSYAEKATQTDYFRGARENKVLRSLRCTGEESHISECELTTLTSTEQCSNTRYVAGAICTETLPDLIPSIKDLETSMDLLDRYMGRMTCAMEENCASSSAYSLKEQYPKDWNIINRRLLRFSTSVFNNGTADFRPTQGKSSWSYHSCHRHYHSMDVFTHYDIVDYQGNRVAEGHKASFCLEDVECEQGKRKRYSCSNRMSQGISVGCADVYKHNLDCQWIDITDLPAGNYVFKLTVNPEYLIPELNYDNNAAICQMYYTGNSVKLGHCQHSRG